MSRHSRGKSPAQTFSVLGAGPAGVCRPDSQVPGQLAEAGLGLARAACKYACRLPPAAGKAAEQAQHQAHDQTPCRFPALNNKQRCRPPSALDTACGDDRMWLAAQGAFAALSYTPTTNPFASAVTFSGDYSSARWGPGRIEGLHLVEFGAGFIRLSRPWHEKAGFKYAAP